MVKHRTLGDADASVRYDAVRGLTRIGAANTVAAIERLRSDPDVRVRLAVQAAV